MDPINSGAILPTQLVFLFLLPNQDTHLKFKQTPDDAQQEGFPFCSQQYFNFPSSFGRGQ